MDLASRVTTRIQITTDGHRAYAEAVEGAFGMDVDYAMLIKLYGAPSDRPDTRYSPAACIGTRTGILSGTPDHDHISTSYVERQNLNLRMGVRRFTRLTNAFSKKFENHCHMVAIYHAYYNFCRVHQTLRVTPAMEAGLAHHVWSLEELVGLLERKAVRRGSVKSKTNPDRVCAAAPDTIKFTIKSLQEDRSYILIEGDKAAFVFLSRLFAAHAQAEDCGFDIGPKCAGNAFFNRGSKLGLYLHRLPCVEKKSSHRTHKT
jgi:hypothetical protein